MLLFLCFSQEAYWVLPCNPPQNTTKSSQSIHCVIRYELKGYDVYGTLLISGEGRQLDWHVVRFDNGKELYTHHIDDVHVDLDFWEVGAKYAIKYWEEHPPECITLDTAKDNDIMQL